MTAARASDIEQGPEFGQELRLATVMTGGVSLAVWMGGLTNEINRVVRAGHDTHRTQDVYLALKRLMDTDVRVDVISGTSAGGINGAVLALAVARDADLSFLRNLWLGEASLTELLRSPTERSPRSLLRGDEYFLPALERAFATISGPRDPADDDYPHLMITTTLLQGETRSVADDYGTIVRDVDHRGLFTFSGPDFANPDIEAALALAARCTASFPGAFEASFCPVGEDGKKPIRPGNYPRRNMEPWIDTTMSRYTVDGGVLVNKPIGPAIEAIFKHGPPIRPVRRILGYIVPDPGVSTYGEREAEDTPPPLGNVLVESLLEIPLAQSISAELARVRDHNRQVASQRRTRDEIVELLASEPAAARAKRRETELPRRYGDYCALRAEHEVDNFLEELTLRLNGLHARHELPDQWRADFEFASEAHHELRDRLIQMRTLQLAPANPANGSVPFPKLWELKGDEFSRTIGAFGLVSLERAGAVVLDLIRRALKFAQRDQDRKAMLWVAHRVHDELEGLRAGITLSEDDVAPLRVTLEKSKVRPTVKDFAATIAVPALRSSTERYTDWVVKAFACWCGCERRHLEDELRKTKADRPSDPVASLGFCLLDAIRLCLEVTSAEHRAGLDPRVAPPDERQALAHVAASFKLLVDGWIATDDERPPSEREMHLRALAGVTLLLELETLQVVLAVQEPVLEQPIELVQFSANSRCGLDPVRRLAADKLTGLQLNHFGAFYKRSWRANDWLWGRLDGVGWLVHLLLEPRRLLERAIAEVNGQSDTRPTTVDEAQSAYTLGPLGHWAYEELSKIAAPGPSGSPVHTYLADLWQQDKEKVRKELCYLDGLGPYGPVELPRSLPHCSMAVARALQYEVLLEELPQVRGAIALDARDGVSTKATGAFCWDYDALWSPPGRAPDPTTPVRLLRECEIPRETIAGEVGSDLLTYVATTAGATGLSAVTQALPTIPGILKPVVAITRGALLTLYFLMRAALQRSRTGFAAAVLAFALGFALLARPVGPPWNVVAVGLLVAPVVLLAMVTARLLASKWRRAARLAVIAGGLVLLLAAPTLIAMWRWPQPSRAPLVRLNLAWAARNPLWVLLGAAVIVLLIVVKWAIGPLRTPPTRLDRALRQMADDLERQANSFAPRQRFGHARPKPEQSAVGRPLTVGLAVDAQVASAIEKADPQGGRNASQRLTPSAQQVVRLARRLLADALSDRPRPTWCLLTLRPEATKERDKLVKKGHRAADDQRGWAVLEVRVQPAAVGASVAGNERESRSARRRAGRLGGALAADLPDADDVLLGTAVQRARFPLPAAPTVPAQAAAADADVMTVSS
jgi:patatin-related protein